jgi:hypothetical protein
MYKYLENDDEHIKLRKEYDVKLEKKNHEIEKKI